MEVQANLPGSCTLPALNRVHETLNQGRELIAERQKLIRIADRLELVWRLVAERNAEGLAGNSEDERGRRSGEGRAVCEKESRKAEEKTC